jgi:uncharacterized membrane protein YczE
MRRAHPQILRSDPTLGAILMILGAGLLFDKLQSLISNLNPLVWQYFLRWWPIVPVAIGVGIIIEARQRQRASRGMPHSTREQTQ